MEMQARFIDDICRRIVDDTRIDAAWLEGSFGRGDADRYSDVDLHLLTTPEHADMLQAQLESMLRDLRPLVLYKVMFDGAMVNALTDEGLRLDVWLHSGATYAIDSRRSRILHARPGALTEKGAPPPPTPATPALRLAEQIAEFWRCIAMLPVVIGRNELIVGHMGLTVEQGILVNVLLDGDAIPRDAGVKKLNPFLPEPLRAAIEAALDMPGLTPAALVAAHMGLARIMQVHGPRIAAQHSFAYPADLEASATAYVTRELERIGHVIPPQQAED